MTTKQEQAAATQVLDASGVQYRDMGYGFFVRGQIGNWLAPAEVLTPREAGEAPVTALIAALLAVAAILGVVGLATASTAVGLAILAVVGVGWLVRDFTRSLGGAA